MHILIILNILFMIFFFVLAYLSIRYFINQIEKYEKTTLEDVYNNKKLRQKYNIENKVNPLDYGYNYKEVEYKIGKIKLYGWLIENENANKTAIISHGRGDNRLYSMQYLQIFKDTNLDKEYNIFLPDLRNSGKSDKARTKLGYNFAMDIYATMEMLKEKYNKNNFLLVGFSQGAMASAIVSKLYLKNMRKKGIKIDKLILDSPLSNVKKKIKEDAKKRRVPKFIVSVVIRVFNMRVGNNLDKLKLSYLLKRVPTLLIQSKNDKATTYGMLIEEYNEIAQFDNIELKVFEKGSHTKIYSEEEYKNEYTKIFFDFIRKK